MEEVRKKETSKGKRIPHCRAVLYSVTFPSFLTELRPVAFTF